MLKQGHHVVYARRWTFSIGKEFSYCSKARQFFFKTLPNINIAGHRMYGWQVTRVPWSSKKLWIYNLVALFCTVNLPGSVCPKAVCGTKMINSTVVLGSRIAIFIHCVSTTVCHCLKKRLWTRKEGSVICDESETKNSKCFLTFYLR